MLKSGVHINSHLTIPESELEFHYTRSSGPGGQHVNKVSTRVELMFDVVHSAALTTHQRERLIAVLGSKLDSEGVLRLSSQESRSQWRNRELVVAKFQQLLKTVLAPRKKRRPTKPTADSKRRRVESKKARGQTKRMRGKVGRDS